ncbi:APC family permease [Ornithinimicrobium sediminis]|uniref:APC family permease n=1 Tax=Ornithinimicrobium sediminis TaxID=2904603 RepID=UPI001E56E8A3|nr:APC family permease [Ornithinimicrobium sediminis]MCE0487888.1 APC family permease [Ornithinimicrobium sediminis]
MGGPRQVLERVFIGRALRTERLSDTLLPKRLGMPVFASDALSSVAYAPDEIVLTLALAGGVAVFLHSWEITLAVCAVMAVIVASYRQNVHAYPSGGGDYEVVTRNLGPTAGLGVGAALMVDYVLTVAVSVSAGVQNAAAALVFLRGYEPVAAGALVGLLTLINLRGVRESGRALAVPVYAFLGSMALMIGVAMVQWATGTLDRAESAAYTMLPAPGYEALTAVGLGILLLRAFASGTVALTGVQGVANGVPALQRPKSANAARILLIMATTSITILLSVILLVRETGIQIAVEPEQQLRVEGQTVGPEFVQDTVLGQLSQVVYGPETLGVLVVAVTTGVMLVVAANTAFNGFPQLTSRLATDGFLPSSLLSRGLRLTYSNGILLLAAGALALVLVYQATVTELIQMYIVGVFISFTLSQAGMVRHWNRQLRLEVGLARRRAMQRSRTINVVGATVSLTVLVVVILTRFTEGAGLSLLAIALLWMVMTMVYRLHREIADETALPDDDSVEQEAVPSRVYALVHVERVDRPTMRALAYARATRPQVLEAVTVDVAPERTQALRAAWEARDIPVTLRFLESPYRETGRPVVDYVRRLHRDRPRDMVVVYLPEYVSSGRMVRWFRDRAQDQLRDALMRTPGVVVASVPWQGSSLDDENPEPDAPPAEPADAEREHQEHRTEPTRAD